MKLALGLLTALNVALTCFGASMAMLSPMMFDAGGDGRLLWAVFWSILAFPVVAGFACSCPGCCCGCAIHAPPWRHR